MVLRNTLWLSASFFIDRIFAFFWQLYLARFFTTNPEQYGYYRLLMSQYTVWILLAEGSLVYAVQQFIAESTGDPKIKVKEFWPFIVGARILTGFLSGIIFILIIGVNILH